MFVFPDNMNTINIKDKHFAPYLSKAEIEAAVRRVALSISADFRDKDPVFLAVLNGSFVFAADLLRMMDFPCTLSFVKLASYSGTSSTQEVHELIGLREDLRGRNVIVVEDIIDSGFTLAMLREQVLRHTPADLRIATLLFKPEAFREHYHIDYTGLSIANDFIVGYGLDYDGYGRNLPEIYSVISPNKQMS